MFEMWFVSLGPGGGVLSSFARFGLFSLSLLPRRLTFYASVALFAYCMAFIGVLLRGGDEAGKHSF